MRISLLAAALIALPVLAACGDIKETAATVTQADIAKSLQDKGLKDQRLADCAAKVFVEQGISQDGLRTMIGDNSGKPIDPETLGLDKADGEKARAAQTKIATECVLAH
ncbi:hypothetical protein [Nocardia sp. NPDC049707]|uniref:hypothetical protein n=1 Tax=Nocardia sp. NPDC049707 TaxID=3154735 RepID=UPI00342241C3